MKEFIRFLITLIVLILVAGTIYYAVIIHGNPNKIIEMKNDKNNVTASDKLNHFEFFEKAKDENIMVPQNQNVIVKFQHTQYATKNMGKDLLGNSIEDFLMEFETEKIPVTFQKNVNNEGTKIIIIPMSDFIDSQEFVYDANGNLILYTKISNTVGGNIQYIFSNNVLIKTVNNMEESIVPIYEEQDEILARANRLYNL